MSESTPRDQLAENQVPSEQTPVIEQRIESLIERLEVRSQNVAQLARFALEHARQTLASYVHELFIQAREDPAIGRNADIQAIAQAVQDDPDHQEMRQLEQLLTRILEGNLR